MRGLGTLAIVGSMLAATQESAQSVSADGPTPLDAVVLQIDADNGHRSVKRYAITLP